MQEPLEIILCSFFNSLLLTPWTTVKSTSFAGAEIITFFAPASICFPAETLSKKKPVHSRTTSAPILPHGNLAGSFSANTFIFWSSIWNPSLDVFTLLDKTPWVLSYFIKWALASTEPKSFIPTTFILPL